MDSLQERESEEAAITDGGSKTPAVKKARPRARIKRPEVEPLAVKVQVAAEMMGVGVTTAKRLIASGKIRSVKLGAVRIVPIAEIKRFLERQAS